MQISHGLCGHFALGTLSKTYLKDVVCEINVFSKKIPTLAKIKNVKFDTQINNRIRTRYYFVSINTFWYVLIYNLFNFGVIRRARLQSTFLGGKVIRPRFHIAIYIRWKTNLKDVVFEINVFSKKLPNIAKTKNVMCYTNIKKIIIFRYYFDSISIFRYTSNRMFSKK